MTKYNSDAIDECCDQIVGHTNWSYAKNPNSKDAKGSDA